MLEAAARLRFSALSDGPGGNCDFSAKIASGASDAIMKTVKNTRVTAVLVVVVVVVGFFLAQPLLLSSLTATALMAVCLCARVQLRENKEVEEE